VVVLGVAQANDPDYDVQAFLSVLGLLGQTELADALSAVTNRRSRRLCDGVGTAWGEPDHDRRCLWTWTWDRLQHGVPGSLVGVVRRRPVRGPSHAGTRPGSRLPDRTRGQSGA
jgi:hypothetical protein